MPCTLGHSRGVAQLSEAAGRSLGPGDHEVTRLRRAALVHDIGRTGISNAIWECEGPLSMARREHVRLHPYYTERVLACCAADLDRPARVLAAADACQAMLQPRPHRPARTLDETARELRRAIRSASTACCKSDLTV